MVANAANAAPVAIDISPDAAGRMLTRITGMADRYADFRPLGYAIIRVLRASFAKNIDDGGRPAFAPLTANTLASKKMLGYPSDPLVRTGLLRKSLAQRNSRGNVSYVSASGEIKVGTNLPYAKYMQEGTRPHVIKPKNKKRLSFITVNGRVTAKSVNHPGTPPRPFILIQPEDWVEIKRLMKLFEAGDLPDETDS